MSCLVGQAILPAAAFQAAFSSEARVLAPGKSRLLPHNEAIHGR